jgi:hypothetical protein
MSDDRDIVWVRIPLSGETAERLRSLSDACHDDPANVAASLLHDVLKDDEDSHYLMTVPAASSAYN